MKKFLLSIVMGLSFVGGCSAADSAGKENVERSVGVISPDGKRELKLVGDVSDPDAYLRLIETQEDGTKKATIFKPNTIRFELFKLRELARELAAQKQGK